MTRKSEPGQAATFSSFTSATVEVEFVPTGTDTVSGRQVFGLFGVPIDVADTRAVLSKVYAAIDTRTRLLLSTVNVNFLLASRIDLSFRESLLASDLCTVDGMPVVWIARLLGIPVKERVAGSDIFERLKASIRRFPIKVFLFGGEDGVAKIAEDKLNSTLSGIRCVGIHYPGFVSVEQMSSADLIEKINSSGADFLAVALGAKKGQAWLYQNHERVRVPVRAHLGATLNFQAGTIKRAPPICQKVGLEWLWRIKEEPKLWSRYAKDGIALAKLVLLRVAPLTAILSWHRIKLGKAPSLALKPPGENATLYFVGPATAAAADKAEDWIRRAAATNRQSVQINLAGLTTIDLRFIGMLLVVRKHLLEEGLDLILYDASVPVKRIFHLSEFGFLLR